MGKKRREKAKKKPRELSVLKSGFSLSYGHGAQAQAPTKNVEATRLPFRPSQERYAADPARAGEFSRSPIWRGMFVGHAGQTTETPKGKRKPPRKSALKKTKKNICVWHLWAAGRKREKAKKRKGKREKGKDALVARRVRRKEKAEKGWCPA